MLKSKRDLMLRLKCRQITNVNEIRKLVGIVARDCRENKSESRKGLPLLDIFLYGELIAMLVGN